MILADTGGALVLLLIFLVGGFTLPHGRIPGWWIWGYWSSPLTYAFNAITVNEFFAPRWMNKKAADDVRNLGIAVLNNVDVFATKDWYWVGVAALAGFAVIFNILFTLALQYLKPLGKPQAVISEEVVAEIESNREESAERVGVKTSTTKPSKGDSLNIN